MQPPIFLIPGLDGSGMLFKPFLDVFPLPVTVLPYNDAADQSIQGLTDYLTKCILDQAGNQPVVIIAESFGGVMTDQILQAGKVSVSNAIFLAGFLRRPNHWSVLGKFSQPTKLSIASLNLVPNKLLNPALFWRFGSPELTALFRQSLNTNIYIKRIELIATLKLNLPRQKVHTPTLYLQASHDSLVSKRSVNDFKNYYTNLTVKRVTASHFLVETNAEDASAAILASINPHHQL